MKNIALVFNCNYNGLGVIHGLSKCKDLNIYALDVRRNVGTFSRFAKFKKVPDVLENEDAFIDYLMKSIKVPVGRKALLFPTNDQWMEAVCRHNERLSEKYIICGPSYDTLKMILSKDVFAKRLESIGIPVPSVFPIDTNLDGLEYPVAIKSVQRRRSGNTLDGQRIAEASDELRFLICNSKSEAEEYIEYARKEKVPVYFQQIVRGDSSSMRTIGLFAKNGIIKGLFFGKKVRGYPAQYGDCIVGEACNIPDWVRDYAKKIIVEINYTGIAELEFMIDSVSQQPYFIEMNPRSWSWVEICRHAGLNLAKIAYENLILEKDSGYSEAANFTRPLRFYKIIEDFINCTMRYKKDGLSDWGMTKKEWKRELKHTENVYAEFPKDDFPIVLYNISIYLCKFIKKIFKKICFVKG